MLLTNAPGTIFNSAAAAKAHIAALNDDDPELVYVVIVDPKGSGRANVEVREADGGALVCKL